MIKFKKGFFVAVALGSLLMATEFVSCGGGKSGSSSSSSSGRTSGSSSSSISSSDISDAASALGGLLKSGDESESADKGEGRNSIDAFLKEYEKFVVKAEKAAEKNDAASLVNLSVESIKLAEKAEKMEDDDEWTSSDATKYLELSSRYAAAAAKMSGSSGSIDTGSLDLGGLDLGGFSF